ncbi:MAG TPA: 2-oxoglutarate dehydrogenase E1 component, partial [Planctomycetota bacterium]|nr:2-oxoglutarate dehydrogenase E1 component [Planctomycetota bacterium]
MDLSNTPLSGISLAFVEGLYADYLNDPKSVSDDWRRFFENAGGGPEAARFLQRPRLGPSFKPSGLFNPPGGNGHGGAGGSGAGRVLPTVDVAALQDRVDQLIRAYRVRGHMISQVDPLGRSLPDHPELDPAFYHLSEADMDRPFSSNTIEAQSTLTLRQIIQRMRNTYCRSIGVQFMHIDDIQVKHWLQKRMERTENRMRLTREQQIHIYTRLTDAVTFEEFIQKKFVAAKSFSLEGAESLIPLMDLAITAAGEQGQDEIVIGMAHRGRLNVLANVMGKSPRAIFTEFEDKDAQKNFGGRGDVKYHLGFSKDHITPAGHKIHLSLCFNPSHLEYGNPVALGRMRAKMDRFQDFDHTRGMVLLIHGDAAFAGEGVVQETLNLSMLEGYTTGGTIHIIVNNQIGFTTPPNEGRSSIYSTDVAKMLESPIFHVNGEDPEAVAMVVKLAMDFRRTFQRDVVIDMYCYRRRGHNESDEPAFTQPILYRAIEQRPNVREGYLQHLLRLGEVTREQADEIDERRRKHLEEELSIARSEKLTSAVDSLQGVWQGYQGGKESDVPEAVTAVDEKRLMNLGELLTRLPTDFHAHPKIERLLESRLLMAQGKSPLDWAMAEALAFATLATDGKLVRLSGQDACRGTFSHRHAVLHDIEDGHTFMPLQNLSSGQAPVYIYNSPLCESGVLGFDYGYSLDAPSGLVLWEAQFGDF